MKEQGLAASIQAIGLMSGTSLDGVDAALLTTDGVAVQAAGARLTLEYDEALRRRIRAVFGARVRSPALDEVERDLTLIHADAVRRLLAEAGLAPGAVAAIGFHGQTISHAPAEGFTWQIGDGALLARRTGIDVICDFRTADVAAGGEGAPLVPVFHRALAGPLEKPLAVLNIGGVANVTWIGADGELLAFDTGPGNALIDDWMLARTGQGVDFEGKMASSGNIDEAVLAGLLAHPYFARKPPKSLDRNEFSARALAGFSTADGAATLTAFTAAAVSRSVEFFARPVRRWLVTGGGRRNPVLMAALAARLDAPVEPVEAVGWDGDALEAQAFAFLAARSIAGLPLSFPTTTGTRVPMPAGRRFAAHG